MLHRAGFINNKTQALILAILLFTLTLLSSCQGSPSGVGDRRENTTVYSDETVIDASGNELNIPADPKNVTIASDYAVAVPFIVALGLSDRVVAVNSKSRFWADNVPALRKAGSVGRGTVDYEKLADYAPSVLIHRAGDPKTVSGAERIGIPVITISAEDYDGVMGTIELMGSYFGAEERAGEVEAYMKEGFSRIDGIVSKIPEGEKVKAICLGSTPGRVAGEDMLQSWMIKKAGGIPVTTGINNNGNWADIGAEKALALNPRLIFLTSSTVLEYSVSDLEKDAVWSGLDAVSRGRLYQIPAKIDSWDLPGVACLIGTFYMLRSMYPDYYTEEELDAEIDGYYSFMFGRTFDREYLGY